MISQSDFLRIPYTRDLTEGGIAYTLHALPQLYHRAGGSVYDRLRRMVANTAVELAFRRHLSQQNIPFEVIGATPFTDPGRYDVTLGGRRCDLKSFLISRRDQINEMKHNPHVLLNAPALVPSEQNAAENHARTDLYLFAFLPGLVAASHDDLQKAIHKKQPHYLIHAMPEEWIRPAKWTPLGRLVFKSESAETQVLRIDGQDEGRERRSLEVELPPNRKVEIEELFFSVASLHIHKPADARIAVHSPGLQQTHVIGAMDWGNIWVYGLEVLLAGWLSREEFNQRAHTLAEGSKVFQYERTRTKNIFVPVRELKPIVHLFERVKEWNR